MEVQTTETKQLTLEKSTDPAAYDDNPENGTCVSKRERECDICGKKRFFNFRSSEMVEMLRLHIKAKKNKKTQKSQEKSNC